MLESLARMVTLAAGALVIAIAAACVSIDMTLPWGLGERPPETPAVAEVGNAQFIVEIANDRWERERGLSGRSHLSPESGMLFVPGGGEVGAFWMKGMRFALDFIWIGEACEVVGLNENVPVPENGTPDKWLPVYEPPRPAWLALEVNAGDVERFDIRVGDMVELRGVEDVDCEKGRGAGPRCPR